MNCKIFTDNLEKYILDDLSDDLKIKMKEHMKFCNHCRELYEEEILFKQAVEEALNFDDIIFTSQKDSVMAKIDKDKYKKDIIIKTKVNPRRYIKWCMPIAAAAIFILIINPITKFKMGSSVLKDTASVTKKVDSKKSSLNSNNIAMDFIDNRYDEESKEEPYEKNNMKEEDKKQISSIQNNDVKKSSVNNVASNEVINNLDKTTPIVSQDIENKKDIAMNIGDGNNVNRESLNIGVEFKKMSLEDNNQEISFGMRKDNIWYNSPNKKLSYSTAYKGDFDIIEEDINKIFIKDLESNKKWSLQLLDNKNKVFIKYAKWIDDERLFAVSEIMKENIVLYEELYIVNTNTGKSLMIYKTENGKISILNVKKNYENNIEVKLSIKNNDNSNETYLEKYTIYNVQNDIIDNNKKK